MVWGWEITFAKQSGYHLKTSVTEVKHRPLRVVFGWGDQSGRIIPIRAKVAHMASDGICYMLNVYGCIVPL